MGKKFNRWLRAQARAGVFVGDINQATAAYQGTAPLPTPPPAQPAAPPPPPPEINEGKPARNTNPRRVSQTGLEDGGNLKIKKKSRRRRQQQAKGTGQLRINPTSVANVSTAGKAASSGGVNV